MTITLPVDADGFLRRECPNCHGQFKWHRDWIQAPPEVEGAELPHRHCPLCGVAADPGDWATPEQLEYGDALQMLDDDRELVAALNDLETSKFLKVEMPMPEEPQPPAEPNDMIVVKTPCHPPEPIKVPEPLRGSYHCSTCGKAFAI